MEKINKLMAFIGIEPTDLPANILANINRYSLEKEAMPFPQYEEEQILAQIKDWFNSRPVLKPTAIPSDVGTRFYSLDISVKVKHCDDNIAYLLKEVSTLMGKVDGYLKDIGPLREERLRLLGLKNMDMTEKLNEVLEDPFWSYAGEPSPGKVRFLTEPVTIRHYDKSQGIDMKVPLGKFYADLSIDGTIKVRPHFASEHPNTCIDGHYHPHISTSGGICWGTAQQVYIDGVKNLTFKPMFIALRAILENYNSGSPYVELYRWAITQGTFDLSKYTITYKLDDSRDSEWILDEDLPRDFCTSKNNYTTDEREDGDGDYVNMVKLDSVYRQYIRELDMFLEDSDYCYITTSGEFKPWPEQ